MPVGIKLALASFPGSGDVRIFVSRTPREQLNVEFMEGLKGKTSGLHDPRKNNDVPTYSGDIGEGFSTWHMPVSLSVVTQIPDGQEGVSDEDESFKDNMLSVEAWIKALEQAAQEGMPLELLLKMRELMLGEIEDVFCRGLTGEPRA